jgi:hypothetical protein
MRVNWRRSTIRRRPSRETSTSIVAAILGATARKSVPAVSGHDSRRDLAVVIFGDFFESPRRPEPVLPPRRQSAPGKPASGSAIRRRLGITSQGSRRCQVLRPFSKTIHARLLERKLVSTGTPKFIGLRSAEGAVQDSLGQAPAESHSAALGIRIPHQSRAEGASQTLS